MYGYYFDGFGGSTYASAVAKCMANGGGMAPRVINPKTALLWGDGKAIAVVDPRNLQNDQPEIVAAVRDVLSAPAKVVELRGLLRRNDAEGVRGLLLAASGISRARAEMIRRAIIGPASFPIFQIPNIPDKCNPPSPSVDSIGGVLLTEVNENPCNPTG